jgi:hypothetical protein
MERLSPGRYKEISLIPCAWEFTLSVTCRQFEYWEERGKALGEKLVKNFTNKLRHESASHFPETRQQLKYSFMN